MNKQLLLEKYIKVAVKKALKEQEVATQKAEKAMYLVYRFPGLNKVEQYCNNNKLIINNHKFENILEILTADILNPVKEKWIFSSVFGDNVISYFKFIKRPDENITIHIDD